MKLSLAVITGNIGASMMNRFLDNFSPLADEIIVVRAIGNQKPDDSLDAAKARGCITGEHRNAFDKDWPHVDDFAAARNYAWSLATGDWIMWADTDDILPPESCEAIRRTLETKGDKFDMLITPYVVPDVGLNDNPRERAVRRGIARWTQPVHECLEPIEPEMKWRTATCMEGRIVHDPGPRPPRGRSGRNLRILESLCKEELTTSLRYHLFAEHFAMGNVAEGAKHAEAFMRLPEAGSVERFECALSLSFMAKDNGIKAQWLQLAYHECPDRREPLVLLSNIAQNAGDLKRAESYLRAASALPMPNPPPWNLRRKMWGWQFVQEQGRVFRGQGNFAKADAIEFNHFKQHGGKISLLHATRGRAQHAVEARSLWLERAENPDAIEHIFACDPDDAEGPMLGGFRHIIQDMGGGPCGAWNMAASIASGEVFVQVSDDMVPPQGWDRLILEALSGPSCVLERCPKCNGVGTIPDPSAYCKDISCPICGGERQVKKEVQAISPLSLPRVLRVSDGHRSDGLIVLAIVTRAWWKQQGYLFHPAFFSMYSDNWITESAEKSGAIIEAPELVFEHRHPAFTGEAMHPTTAQSNRLLHYAEGAKILEQLRAGKEPFTWRDIPGCILDDSPSIVHERIIASIDKPVCLEVGVASGRGLACMAMLAEYKRGRTYGVDAFTGTPGEAVPYPDDMQERCKKNISDCGLQAIIIPEPSIQVATAFKDVALDYVFIDAAHDYENVKADIAAWRALVKPGGWLAGHDYTNSEGVKRAVDEAFPHAEKVGACWLVQL